MTGICLFTILYLTLVETMVDVQAVAETLEVGTSGSAIRSVLGCTERFICEGEGTSIRWTIGSRIEVTNTTDRLITTSINAADNTVRSFLTFSDVKPEHGREYSCNIDNGRSITTLRATLEVKDDYVYIEPIEDIDISNSALGQTLTIRCRVATCQDELHIAIVKGTQLIKEHDVIDETMSPFVNAHLVISHDTADQYACRVRLPNGTVFYERFTVTGTPQGEAEFLPPRPSSEETTNQIPDGNGMTKSMSTRNGCSTITTPWLQLTALLLLSVYFLDT